MRIIIICLLFVQIITNPLSFAQNGEATIGSTKSVTRKEPIKLGEMAPNFTLEDHNGRTVTLSSARGEEAVVLVFYRGYW